MLRKSCWYKSKTLELCIQGIWKRGWDGKCKYNISYHRILCCWRCSTSVDHLSRCQVCVFKKLQLHAESLWMGADYKYSWDKRMLLRVSITKVMIKKTYERLLWEIWCRQGLHLIPACLVVFQANSSPSEF